MKMKITVFASLLLVAFLAMSAVAIKADEHKPGEKVWQRMVDELKLTAEQQDKLRPLFEARRQAMKARHDATENKVQSILTPEQQAKMAQIRADRQAAREARERSRSAWKSMNLTDDQKAQMKAILKQTRVDTKAERENFHAQVGAVLNPDQKAKLEQMQRHHGYRHHGHRRDDCDCKWKRSDRQ